MSMTGIFINGPSDIFLIICVHFWTLKSIDNASSFLRVPTKFCLECDMVTEQRFINENGNSSGVKVSLVSLVTGLGCANHAGDVG